MGKPYSSGLVLAMASSYSAAKISPLIASIRATGSRCDISVIQHDFNKAERWQVSDDLFALQKLLDFEVVIYSQRELKNVANFFRISFDDLFKVPVATLRFFLYHHYLSTAYEFIDGGRKFFVIHVDAKDVMFQTDLFMLKELRTEDSEVLYAALETNSKSGWRVGQRARSFTKEFFSCLKLYRQPTMAQGFKRNPPEISCSGTILGTFHAVVAHFKNIVGIAIEILDESQLLYGKRIWPEGCLDQSLHVLSLESRTLESAGILIKRISTCDGIIGTLGFWGCQNRVDEYSRIVNCKGEPLSVIHQYHFYTEEICAQMSMWPWNRTVHSGQQRYEPKFSHFCGAPTRLITGKDLIEVSTSNILLQNSSSPMSLEDSILLNNYYDPERHQLFNTFQRHLNENVLGNSFFYCLIPKTEKVGRKACIEEYCLPC